MPSDAAWAWPLSTREVKKAEERRNCFAFIFKKSFLVRVDSLEAGLVLKWQFVQSRLIICVIEKTNELDRLVLFEILLVFKVRNFDTESDFGAAIRLNYCVLVPNSLGFSGLG